MITDRVMKYYEILYNFPNIYVYSCTLCITLCIEGYITDCDHSDTRYHVTLHSCKMVFRVSYYKKDSAEVIETTCPTFGGTGKIYKK